MRIIYTFLATLLCLVSLSSLSQQQTAVFLESASATGVQQMFYKNSVVKNAGNDVFTCGATINEDGDYDILLTKHNSSNVLQWSVTYAGSYGGDDYASDLAIDTHGNIIVTGTKQVGTLDYDAVTIKYNSSGTQQWATSYAGAGSGPDGCTTVLLDASNNIYVAGGAFASIYQLTNSLCIKYDTAGTALWTNTWNNSTYNLEDAAARIVLSGSYTYVYTATEVDASPIAWKLSRQQYVSSTGSLTANGINYGDTTTFATVSDIATDNVSYIYVSGTVNAPGEGKNLRVARFNTNFEQDWLYDFNGTDDLDDEALSMEVNGTSHVYLTGYTTSTTTGKDIYCARLGATSGTLSWENIIDYEGGDDSGTALKLDGSNNPIIGASVFKESNLDVALIKLASSTGTSVYTGRYNGDTNDDDYAINIAVNGTTSEVYIASQSKNGPSTYSSTLLKWAPRTIYIPVSSDILHATGFAPNFGQLRTDTVSNESIKFYSSMAAPQVFINDTIISYVMHLNTDTTDTTHRVDMMFTKGNTYNKVYPFEEQDHYANYYLNYCKPIERNPFYNSIIKSNVYTNTDAILQTTENGFRTWLVCRSGAPTGDLEMTYDGHDALSIDGSGNLIITTSIGSFTQSKAHAYTMNLTTGVLTTLGWQPTYVITGGDKVSFTLGSWTGTLVIKMDRAAMGGGGPCITQNNLDWATYFGTNDRDESTQDISIASTGWVYIGGRAGGSEFPILPGETNNVDDTYDHGDGFVSCFDDGAKLIWSTFTGGNKDDLTKAVAINETSISNKLYAAGKTLSTSNFSWVPTSGDDFVMEHNNPNGSVPDAWVMRLNELNGSSDWGTYISSTAFDEAVDLVPLDEGQMILIGNTKATTFSVDDCETNSSDNLFPLCAPGTAYFDNSNNSSGDIFITLFNSNNTISWSTLFGNGYAQKALEASSIIGSDYFWIVGKGAMDGYESTDTDSYMQDGSEEDAFAVKFTTTGELRWSTGFQGVTCMQSVTMAEAHEQTIRATTERILMAGYTAEFIDINDTECTAVDGSVTICTPSGAYVDNEENGRDIYIAEFTPTTNHLTWSTLYGSESRECVEEVLEIQSLEYDYDKFMDITTDTRGYVYVCGLSSSQHNDDWGFPLYEQDGWFYQDYCGDYGFDLDVFILGFNSQRQLFWSTFYEALFGESDGSSIPYYTNCLSQLATFESDYLYFAGLCPSESLPLACPATPDPYCESLENNLSFSSAIVGRFDVTANAPISVNDKTEYISQSMVVFPVPTEDVLSLGAIGIRKASFRIVNSIGQVVLSSSNQDLSKGLQIDIRMLAQDAYTIQVYDSENKFVGRTRFVKVK